MAKALKHDEFTTLLVEFGKWSRGGYLSGYKCFLGTKQFTEYFITDETALIIDSALCAVKRKTDIKWFQDLYIRGYSIQEIAIKNRVTRDHVVTVIGAIEDLLYVEIMNRSFI